MADVAWAPALPAGWSAAKLRWVSRIYAGGTPDRENLDFWASGNVPWLNSGAVNDSQITHPSEYISDLGLKHSSARWVPASSIVIALAGQGKTKGTPARLEIASTINQSMAAIVPHSRLDYRYLYFWLASNYQSIRNLAGGDKRDGLNLEHVSSIEIPLPPLREQQAIAGFLDRETTKLDVLIAKQEQLITTLGERRIEVLRKLLTTGNADVTDIESSGLLWAPLINKRWNLAPLKWSAVISSGSNPDSIGEQSEQNRIEVIGGNGVLGFTSSPNAEAGMIAIGRVGALCGNIHLLDKPTWISDNALRLAPSHKYDPRYLAALLQARGLNELANRTAQPLLVGSLVMNERLPIPPLQSQKEIMTRHEVVRSAIHELVSKTKEMILLLSERRQSLVTAAVTGKLEVSH